MEPTTQDRIAELLAKDTWSMDDHNEMLHQLHTLHDAPRKFRGMLAELRAANPQPKGGVALKIGFMFYMSCRLDEALEVLAEATDNKDRRFLQGLCLKALRQYAKAAEEFERAEGRGWDATAIAIAAVELKALGGDLDGAEKALGKISGKLGQTADIVYLRGLIDELSGLKHQAAESYGKALQLNPAHADAMFRLAYYHDLHGEESRAVELYRQCISRPPVHVNALMNLAVLYEDAHQYDKAVRCLQSVLLNNPNHLRAKLFLKDVDASMHERYDEERARLIARRNAVLDIPVTDFELSVRARNCLKKMNIRCLGDLVRISETELLAYKNFGETSLREIKEMLTAKGLHLGQALEEGSDLKDIFGEPAQPAPAQNDGIMAKPIDQVEFSIRARRALANLNVQTLGDLANKSEGELLACKNFGQTSLNEVRQRLSEHNLKLREPL